MDEVTSQVKKLWKRFNTHATNWSSKARPVQLITFPQDIDHGSLTFNTSVLDKMIKNSKIEEKGILVVSITGVFRSGKSFLLNMMKTYLDYYAKHHTSEGWEHMKDLKIEGGAWARSATAVTHGIWIWDQPFIINEIAVLLMDCQGTGDCEMSSPTIDNLILYLGLDLSNVQILNLQATLQSSDLERLKLCADYADIDGDDTGKPSAIFDGLVFLVRDWEKDDYLGERPNALQDLIKEAKSDGIKKLGRGIINAFTDIHTFMLPHPGPSVTKCSDYDAKLKMRNVEWEFLLAAKDLFDQLFLRSPTQKQLINGHTFVRRFQALNDRVMEKGVIHIKTGPEALEESLFFKEFQRAQEYYDSEMKKACTKEFENEEEARDVLTRIVVEMNRRFNESRTTQRYGYSAIKRKYQKLLYQKEESLEDKLGVILDAFRLKKKRNILEKQKQDEDVRRKQIEEQRKKDMARLLEEKQQFNRDQVEFEARQRDISRRQQEERDREIQERAQIAKEEKAERDRRLSLLESKLKEQADQMNADRKRLEAEFKQWEIEQDKKRAAERDAERNAIKERQELEKEMRDRLEQEVLLRKEAEEAYIRIIEIQAQAEADRRNLEEQWARERESRQSDSNIMQILGMILSPVQTILKLLVK